MRSHGMNKNEEMNRKHGLWYYEMENLGFNYRITDIQCAIGISQLERLESFIKKRQKIAKIYNEHFNQIDYLSTPSINYDISHAYHLYPIQIHFDKIDMDKNTLFKLMKNKNILLQVHYIPVHTQPFYKNKYGFKVGQFEIAESFYKYEVSLPIYPDLSEQDLNKVINELNQSINVI